MRLEPLLGVELFHSFAEQVPPCASLDGIGEKPADDLAKHDAVRQFGRVLPRIAFGIVHSTTLPQRCRESIISAACQTDRRAPTFSHGRDLTSASHLAGGFTASGAFFAPTIGNCVDPEGNQQRPCIRNAPLFRSVSEAGVISEFHKTRFGSFQERNHA